MSRSGAGSQDGECSALHALILDHLEIAGVPASLVSDLRAALEQTVAKHHGKPVDSRLLSVFKKGGGQAIEVQPEGVAKADKGVVGDRGSDGDSATLGADAPLLVQRRHHQAGSAGPCRGIFPVLLVILSSLIFLPCVTYSQWYIDELFAAVRNADARGETPLRELLAHDFWGNPLWDGGWTHKSYRPLVVLSYALQYRFNSDVIKPQPLRAFNVALHTANSVLLYAQLRRGYAPWRWACLAACLFAAQPVHSENVVYLVGRADALATLCWLLALLAWPTHPGRGRGCLSGALRLLLCTLLAVVAGLCKESGFCVLVQLALGGLLSRRPLRAGTPPLAVFAVVFLGRSWLTGGTKAGFSFVDTPVQYHSDAGVRFFTYLYFHAKYAQLLVFPWSLSWDYSHDALPLLRETCWDVRFLAVLTAYLGVAAVASWGAAKRSRGVVFGLGNVIVPFVPASNLFFLVGVTVGERLLYPSNIGAAMVVAAVGGRVSAGGQRKGRAAKPRAGGRLFLLGVLWFCIFAARCGLRVYQWSDRERLFGPDAASYPRSTKNRHQFGTVLHRLGRFDEALEHFNAAMDLYKDNALTEYCIAQIYIETGRSQLALERFESILGGHAMGFGSFNIYALYVDYGFTLMMLRRFEEAVTQLVHGLSLNEDVPHGLNALGYSLMQLGRGQEARTAFERGLHYDEDNPYLLNNLGVTLLLTGQLQAGVDFVARALQAEPGVPAFAHNARVVRALAETGTWPQEQLALELFFNRGN